MIENSRVQDENKPLPIVWANLPREEGYLSDRELHVVSLVACGMSNKEIGKRLFVTQNTVKKHLAHISQKLGASGRAHIVFLAMRKGIIS